MTLRNITVDDSVRYNSQSEKTQQRDFKPSTLKAGSLPRKHNKKSFTKQ